MGAVAVVDYINEAVEVADYIKNMEEKDKTKFGKFLQKVGRAIPDIGSKVLGSTPIGAIFELIDDELDRADMEEKEKNSIKLEMQKNRELFEQEIKLMRMEKKYEDLANAREENRILQTSKYSTKLAKFTPYIIDLFVTLIWGAMTVFIVAKALNPDIVRGADLPTILGIYAAVTGTMSTILNFHRGSSESKEESLKHGGNAVI